MIEFYGLKFYNEIKTIYATTFYKPFTQNIYFGIKILKKLDKINLPEKYGGDIPFVKTSDADEAAAYGLDQEGDLPKIVLFENGIPELYEDGKNITISYMFILAKYYVY